MTNVRYIIGLSLGAGLVLAMLLNTDDNNVVTKQLLRLPFDNLATLVRTVSGTSYAQNVK